MADTKQTDPIPDISATLHSEITRRSFSVPDELFHYTTTQGLLGILNNKCLRATHALYLNDATEFQHGLGQYLAFCKGRSESTIDAAEKEFLKSQDDIASLFDAYPIYVFSLTATSNQLNQWRAYGGNAGGFAIGFKGGELENLIFADDMHPFLEEVVYEPSKQNALFHEVVENVLPEFEKYRNVEDKIAYFRQEGTQKIFMKTLFRLVECFSCFKNQAFEEEKEYRLVCLPFFREAHHVDFFSRGELLVPYCALQAPEGAALPITSITIGPRLREHLARRSLELLLKAKGYGKVEIRESGIPLRPS